MLSRIAAERTMQERQTPRVKERIRKLDSRPNAGSKPLRLVAAALILRPSASENGGTEVLVCQLRPDQPMGLKWEFPGGKIEPGETAEHALVRELEEELAIQARIGPQLARSTHQYPGRAPMELIFFSVREFHGVPVNRAFEQFRWEKPARLPEYDFLEADAAILRTLAE